MEYSLFLNNFKFDYIQVTKSHQYTNHYNFEYLAKLANDNKTIYLEQYFGEFTFCKSNYTAESALKEVIDYMCANMSFGPEEYPKQLIIGHDIWEPNPYICMLMDAEPMDYCEFPNLLILCGKGPYNNYIKTKLQIYNDFIYVRQDVYDEFAIKNITSDFQDLMDFAKSILADLIDL